MNRGLFALLALPLASCAPRPTPPPDRTQCNLVFSDEGDVRVFVVGHRFSLADADSYDAFEASFRRDMARIAPCLSRRRPNLVTFPEDAGLVAWFIGRRALLARNASTSGDAFNAIYAGYYRPSDYYRTVFPGISPARALTLALSDVAWRAMDRTFGGIARTYGVWVITSANLPVSERRDPSDPRAALLRDPDVPAHEPFYVARTSECFNTALLYAPDGNLVQRVNKVYLTDIEEQLLNLSNGRLDELNVFELPFGRVGAAISRDAFYPPFVQRMEDMGVELVVQPEAFSGWVNEPTAPDWLPDVITVSGWAMTQKYRGLRYSVAPMLTGNLFETFFDGQVWITEKATPDMTPLGFVGSSRQRGFRAIGPWAYPDPIERDPSLTIAERRQRLRTMASALRPRSGSPDEGRYAESVIAADLFLYGEHRRPPVHSVTPDNGTPSRPIAPTNIGHQFHPEGAYDSSGRLYVVFTDTRDGHPQVYFTTSDDDGQTWTPARPVAPSPERQMRPTVAAGTSGQVLIAWQQGDNGSERIHVASSNDGGRTLTVHGAVEHVGAAQWEPDLAFRPDGTEAALVWVDFREGLAPKVRISRSRDLGAHWTPSIRVDPSNTITTRTEGSQLQPSITWGARLAVAWIDYRERDWAVWAAIGSNDNENFERAQQVSPPSDHEVLASDPQLAQGPDGEILLAWNDLRERRAHSDIRAARWQPATTRWQPFPLLAGGADEFAEHAPDREFTSRFRPTIGTTGGRYRLVFQDLSPGKNALSIVIIDPSALASTTTMPMPVRRFDDTGRASNQLTRPRLVTRQDLSRGVVLFEDDREGWSRIRVSSPI